MYKTIFVPVLYGEGETQVLVVNDESLPEPALKIWDVKVQVKNLTGQVCKGKVIFQGILHKQILYIIRKSETVRHHQVNIPFSGMIDIPCAEPYMTFKFSKVYVKESCSSEQLLHQEYPYNQECPYTSEINPSPEEASNNVQGLCPTILHEKHVIEIQAAVYKQEKIPIPYQHQPMECEKGDNYNDPRSSAMYTSCSEWKPCNSKTQT